MIASASFAPFFLANSPGDELDMPEELATDLIAAGCAQLVEEPEGEKVIPPADEKPTESNTKKAKGK